MGKRISKTRAFEAANPHLPKCPCSPLLAAQWRVKHGIDPAPPAAISLREKYEQAMAEKRAAMAEAERIAAEPIQAESVQ